MRFLSLRALFLLAFVVAMPVLALPPVARWIDEFLYGPPPTDFGRAPSPAPPAAAPALLADRVAPASYLEESPAAAVVRGLDGVAAAAPPLAPVPVFSPVVPPAAIHAEAAEQPIDAATIARLQQIRQRLEELGAEYVVVDTPENGRGYRCLCRMLVDPRSRFTRPFEAAGDDPLAVSEQVLREVEQWRSAAVSGGRESGVGSR